MVALVAGGLWWYFHPTDPLHDRAVADATSKVDKVLDRFEYDHLHKASDYAHSAGQHSDVTVLDVDGETHWQTGVTLVLQVIGHAEGETPDGLRIGKHDEPICFRIQLGPDDDSRDDDIDCPAGPPVPVTKDPTLRGVDDLLKSALESVGPDEAAVRVAIAGLELDPAIEQKVAVRDGMVGVSLRASQYDCLLARVTSKGPALWRPSHTQLAPGELPCSAGVALSSEFGKYPH
ncbi:hypothetical protein BDK92_0183 [Micromonospora pisi]|uniref:Uncharacterized protein n=1 Tax=Micromonospora pisi TaxID=589240 RepID=A0A495JAN5_9ACTN|nr:hypothetical protein BDK92_0183 [Micromonospora pisi]